MNGVSDTPSEKLVVLAHGLCGHADEYIHQMSRHFFNEKGYDVVRFNFYSDEDGARALEECVLADHVSDLNTVLKHFEKEYNNIYLAGHSYGGLTLLFTNPQNVKAVSFWDSTFVPIDEFWENEVQPIPNINCYAVKWGGMTQLIGKKMHEEVTQDLTSQKAHEMVAAFNAPTQIVSAGADFLSKFHGDIYALFTVKKEHVVIDGADHCFYARDSVFDLLENTHKWFEDN